MSNNKVDIKVVLLGDWNVGKTALLERFINNRFNERPYQATIGGAFAAKSVTSNGKSIMLGVWDTAGSERYKSMLKMFYRGAHAAIVCYDVCEKNSWDQMRNWVAELRNHEEQCKVYLCGTKKDLVDDQLQERKINYQTASEYAKGIQVKLIETSSKTGENVDQLFQMIADNFEVEKSMAKNSYQTITVEESSNRRYCCKYF